MDIAFDTCLDMLSLLKYNKTFSLTLSLTIAIIASYYFVKWSRDL